MILEKLGEEIRENFPKYALILTNGTILDTSLDMNVITKIFPTISSIIDQLDVDYMFINEPVYIYRFTENFLLILLTRADESVVSRFLERLSRKYRWQIEQQYKKLPNSLEPFIKFVIFSVARKMGPEPVAWVIKDENVSEDKIFTYSVSSMMLLINELSGAHKRVLNFHPFISDDLLGAIFLFQIPFEEARGGAFDSSIMLGVDYGIRALLYQKHYDLERIMSISGDELVNVFIENFSDDIHKPINLSIRQKFVPYLNRLLLRINSIPITFHSDDIKEEMKDSIKALKELL